MGKVMKVGGMGWGLKNEAERMGKRKRKRQF
jgi:hypothetical protein